MRQAAVLAGFGVLSSGGGLTGPGAGTGVSQGIAFDDWEIDSMAGLLGRGFAMSIEDLSASLTALPEMRDAPVDRLLLQGMRDNAGSGRPALRFWARFLVESGKLAPEPYDILAGATPSAVQLDAVQFGFVMRRLSADLFALGRRSPATPPGDEVEAALRSSGLFQRDATEQSAPLPCSLGTTEGMIFDGAALGAGLGFGQLMEYLEEHGLKSAGGIAKATGDYTFPVTDWEDTSWVIEGSVTDEQIGAASSDHDPSGHKIVRARFVATLRPLPKPEEQADWANADAAVRTYIEAQWREGWNMTGTGIADMTTMSYDYHPGTTYNCRAQGNRTGKVTVLGKLKDGVVQLAFIMISDNQVDLCLGHTTAPLQGGIHAGMVLDYKNDALVPSNPRELLTMNLADGATGRVSYYGREHGDKRSGRTTLLNRVAPLHPWERGAAEGRG